MMKYLALVLVFGSMALPLSGCSKKEPAPPAPQVTITADNAEAEAAKVAADAEKL